jgi:hypothetical protein
MSPNQPGNGVVSFRFVAWCQSTVPARTGPESRREREQRGARRHRDRGARRPLHAAEIDRGEQQHEADGRRHHGQVGQIPVVQCRRRQQRAEARRRHPAPPVAEAREVREHRVVRPVRLRARRGDAADAVRVHEQQFGPAGRRGPAEQHAQHQQQDRRAALSGDVALADEQRREDEHALVAAAHRERRRGEPAERARMRRVSGVRCRAGRGGDVGHARAGIQGTGAGGSSRWDSGGRIRRTLHVGRSRSRCWIVRETAVRVNSLGRHPAARGRRHRAPRRPPGRSIPRRAGTPPGIDSADGSRCAAAADPRDDDARCIAVCAVGAGTIGRSARGRCPCGVPPVSTSPRSPFPCPR